MIAITIMYARMENKNSEIIKFDPFVTMEVAGMANDCRELRSPRSSRCEIPGLSEEIKKKYACWMFPLKITITSSEFAFLQIGLRTYIGDAIGNVADEGVSLSTVVQSRRRISATSNTNVRREEGNTLQTIGKSCFWVNSLKSGYRSVKLMSNNNDIGPSQSAAQVCLFVFFFIFKNIIIK